MKFQVQIVIGRVVFVELGSAVFGPVSSLQEANKGAEINPAVAALEFFRKFLRFIGSR
jgi:hypothetical protein